MSELSRRHLLRALGAAAMSAASIDMVAAQAVHEMAAGQATAGGSNRYVPKALTVHEYETLDDLTAVILPSEPESPGAREAGAAAWIDLLASENAQLLAIYSGGLAWLDRAMKAHGAEDFLTASAAQRRSLLDLLAYKENQRPELGAGVRFFEWARRMTVDAFYTSAIGIEALGYRGNSFLPEFKVPAEVMDYVNRRSPV
jgi:gluconate 2-dehydrogenase gamma chain